LGAAGGEVDNRQARVSQPAPAIRRGPFPAGVWAAMMNKIKVKRCGPA
jgi:hypothetical protein